MSMEAGTDVGLCIAEREREFQKQGLQEGSSQLCQLCAWPLTCVVSCNLQNNLVKWVIVFPFYLRGSETERTFSPSHTALLTTRWKIRCPFAFLRLVSFI